MILNVEPLTAEAFAPFGDVIYDNADTSVEINTGYTTRFHALATADVGDSSAIMSIFRGRTRPMEIGMLERHPLGSQAFMPLNEANWLAVVAQEPTPESCKAFLCKGSQGVQYARNVWHHPLLVLDNSQDFLVIDRANGDGNLEEVFFDTPLTINL